jgi:ribosomal protein S12 methylthiotransferase
VEGAKANELPDHVPEIVQQHRWERFMKTQQAISTRRLQRKVGKTLEVLIDEVDEEGAIGRSAADAPEIDGNVFINDIESVERLGLQPGDLVDVKIEHSDEYDLWGTIVYS